MPTVPAARKVAAPFAAPAAAAARSKGRTGPAAADGEAT